jgi:hypothetical protein
MRLPNAGVAKIEKRKVVDYLLSQTHPQGRLKARFFNAIGYGIDTWETLADNLRVHGAANAVKKMEATKLGDKYVVEGPLRCPNGRTSAVVTVWFIPPGESVPRLVTAYPKR